MMSKININWEQIVEKLDQKYNLLVENKEELIIQVIRVGYELLPWPVRIAIPPEKWENIIREYGDRVWEAYQKLKNRDNE